VVALITLLAGPFSFSYADEIVFQDPIATSTVVQSRSTSAVSFSGFTNAANEASWITRLGFWVQASTTGVVKVGVECTNVIGGARCAGWTAPSVGGGTQTGLVGVATATPTIGGAHVDYFFTVASTTAFYDPATQQLSFFLSKFNAGDPNATYFGNNNTDRNCVAGGAGTCTFPNEGTPYLYIWGQPEQPNQFASTSRIISQIAPLNGATTASTEVQFDFSWFNSGQELYTVAQAEISDVTGGIQLVPQQSNAALSGTGQTTQIYELQANHYHIWRGCLLNPTTAQKTCSPFHSFEVVGPSASSSFPVVPDINETNATSSAQGGMFAFLNVPQLMQSKYPFSWFFDIADLYQELQASSTEDVATVTLDYSSLDISTTTKNALPSSWTVFGTTTITAFIPEPVLDAWRVLMSAVIWMAVVAYLYHAIARLFSGQQDHV